MDPVIAVLRNPLSTRNTLPKQTVLHRVRQNRLHKVLKGQEMELEGSREPQEKSMNKFQLRTRFQNGTGGPMSWPPSNSIDSLEVRPDLANLALVLA